MEEITSLCHQPPVIAGLSLEFWFNRDWREARVLAVRGTEALIEFRMPTFTGLRILDLLSLHAPEEQDCRDRPVRYHDLSCEWLQLLVEQRQQWFGLVVNGAGRRMRLPGPAEMLRQRVQEAA